LGVSWSGLESGAAPGKGTAEEEFKESEEFKECASVRIEPVPK